ncbi:MAG: MFS transporter [Tannerella sp.]|jgi:MFS family permease|nr:MFS transporter [Tannerella sp.]
MMRWTALGLMSLTMMAAYFFYDAMAPLKGMLERTQGWSSDDYGIFTSAYSWFNVFLLMLFIGGLILDRKGIRFTGTLAASLMVVGAVVKYAALSGILPVDGEFLGFKMQVLYASVGYGIYGVGAEVAGVVVTRALAKWFKGYEMALAMGLQVAIARLGTGIALLTANPLAQYLDGIPQLILFGVTLLVIGLVTLLIYNVFLDKRLDNQMETNIIVADEEQFRLADVKTVIRNRGFWLLATLCVVFYSCVFPFLKYAPDIMTHKFGVSEDNAGSIAALLPFGTIILTPLFGGIYDKKGKGATIMLIGALMLVLVHSCFSVPGITSPLFAIALMILLGISFSLVPSAMWPAVTKILPENLLGTAYALIFWVQNIGLLGMPILIGHILENRGKTVSPEGAISYDYTAPMLIFASLAVLSVVISLLLAREDKIKGYGLEKANIKN